MIGMESNRRLNLNQTTRGKKNLHHHAKHCTMKRVGVKNNLTVVNFFPFCYALCYADIVLFSIFPFELSQRTNETKKKTSLILISLILFEMKERKKKKKCFQIRKC
jgi:hypothetical protein